MKYYVILIIVFCLTQVCTIYGQKQLNQTVVLSTKNISYDDLNKNLYDEKIIKLENMHSTSWQIKVNNMLYYENNNDVIIKFYDIDKKKFIEIGMGGEPENKFWVAAWLYDYEYVIIHKKLERGWVPGSSIIIAYSEHGGLTINNGERIIISNLDISDFSVAYYSFYSIKNHDMRTGIYSGNIVLEFMSGDPTKNPMYNFPFYLVIVTITMVLLLLIVKKRS